MVEKILGNKDYVETGISGSESDESKKKVVTVEGQYSVISELDPEDFVPDGLTLENSHVETIGDGFARLLVYCTDLGEEGGGAGTIATRTTWKITMTCVQTDLKNHPDCVADRGVIEMWLNTEPLKRYNSSDEPQYVDFNGSVHEIKEGDKPGAWKFIKAYAAGIETYNRYFPILQKISYYKRLPGVSVVKKSTTTGTVTEFSNDIGKWSVPGVKLSGFADTGWFKSGDSYEQDNSMIWTRIEEWTWTPKGSNDADLKWIYQAAATGGGGAN